MDQFRDEFKSAIVVRFSYIIVMGDFSVKPRRGRKAHERYTGKYDIGIQNNRGDKMVTVVETNEMFISNTRFQKKAGRKWTLNAPFARNKDEIDYMLVGTLYILGISP